MPHTKSKPKNTLAFTLVELIVVVTILAILATIGFVSYSSYLTGVRDTNRLAQLVSISDGLELYSTKNNLPLPDDNVEVQANGTTIAYQGYAGANTLETIDFTKGGKDPRDDQYFTYYLTKDRKYFQLMGFLEESVDISTRNTQNNNSNFTLNIGLLNSTHAVDYTDRIPSVYGKKLGILTDTTNTPIQEISTITTAGNIDVVTDDTTDYVAHMSDTSTMTGSTAGNSNLAYLGNNGIAGGIASSCKTLIDRKSGLKGQDGVYLIDPEGNNPFPVYCDMTTDGGGWTFFMFYDATTTGIVQYFENEVGNYNLTRTDTGTAYSIPINNISDTEMMVTIDDLDPSIAEENSKIVFYSYGASEFFYNNGPLVSPSAGYAVDGSYRLTVGGQYTETTLFALTTVWYPRIAGSSSNMFSALSSSTAGTHWGNGMGGNGSWGNDAWWYVR